MPYKPVGADENGKFPPRVQVALSATILDKIKTDSVPRWKATTAYLAGDKVLSPTGDVVSAKVDFTSGAAFNSANWDYATASPTVVSGAVDAERVRADAAYRAKDSTIFIPYDHSWWSSVGTETEGFGPDSSGNPRRVWGLSLSGATPADAASNPGAHTRIRVPYGWNTVSVRILYTPTTTAGGNAAWNGGIYNMADGNNFNAGSGLASAATSVGTTAWVQKSHLSSTVLAVDSTKTQLLHIYRNALSATDTYNDAVLFLGVEINWIS